MHRPANCISWHRSGGYAYKRRRLYIHRNSHTWETCDLENKGRVNQGVSRVNETIVQLKTWTLITCSVCLKSCFYHLYVTKVPKDNFYLSRKTYYVVAGNGVKNDPAQNLGCQTHLFFFKILCHPLLGSIFPYNHLKGWIFSNSRFRAAHRVIVLGSTGVKTVSDVSGVSGVK